MKQDFFELLGDHQLDGGQRWSKVKDKLEGDPRYKAVESSNTREELYKQYVDKQAKVGGIAVAPRSEATCSPHSYTDSSSSGITQPIGTNLPLFSGVRLGAVWALDVMGVICHAACDDCRPLCVYYDAACVCV